MKGKKGTTEEFIKRANDVHNFRYDYSKSVYTGYNDNKNKIEIYVLYTVHFFKR
jgi:hypothetical protein